ncbi:hypothetical protein [Avrilella dinanensis]|uniref:Uncharacterized protein n=1 Tax=Avrilella dinanensis TaxID=2008672 RepID=A0A2M9R6H0_9FLAO|nr:hypothetical protein [Avrilella dinanensis]PJR04444.1 hypothetical protein CDL10_07760 [Avrilella dinanensis]
MKKTITLLITFFCGLYAFSQEYFPEKITIDNQSYDYRYHHLESLFNQFPSQRIVESDGTILHRNYIAEFTIAQDSLIYLTNLKVKDKTENWINGNNLLHDRPDLTRPLYWISGLFEVGLGEPDYTRDSLHPVYENYLVMEFRRGKVTRKREFNALQMSILKENQWKKFHGTNAYVNVYQQLKKNGMPDADIRDYIRKNILFYSKKFYLRF